jgi:phage terminase large subunit-like protein
LTGAYPPWWQGKRFDHPVHAWIAGESGQSVRDTAQTHLFGTPGDPNAVGLIAPGLIIGLPDRSHGTQNLFDTVRVRHASGGVSTVSTKTYEQDRGKWQGATLDLLWLDEESPAAIYGEALSRLTGDGIMFTTFTPLMGRTELVERFLHDGSPEALRDRGVVRMSLDEAEHFTPLQKAQRLAGYQEYERDARAYGEPMMGEGRVFDQSPATLSIDSTLQAPLHWAKLVGMDWGVTHPFAAVLTAWDRETDIFYVLDTIRLKNSRPIEHVSAINRIAAGTRCAWPHDMSKRESNLDTITSNYRQQGLLMLPQHASFPDGSISTEAGILEMQERMADGRFRVKAHCVDWFEEYRGYYRKDGQLVKVRDDLLSATRIALMMKRFGRPGPIGPSLTGRAIPVSTKPRTDFDLFSGRVFNT